MTNAHWHILGAGSIGCLWAHKLRQQGHPVTLLFRSHHKAQQFIQHGGLCVRHNNQQWQHDVESVGLETLTKGSVANLLVTTKSWQSDTAIEAVRAALKPQAEVVLMQNGYGQLQTAIPLLKNQRYFVASTTDGAYFDQRHCLTIAGLHNTYIGAYNPIAHNNLSTLPYCESIENIEPILWRKLCINAVINPLTAIHNVPNGQILKVAMLAAHIKPLSAELAAIAKACGQRELDRNTIEKAVRDVAYATANNSSSMRQDVLQARKTEADEILGFLTKKAQQHQLVTPSLNRLYSELLKIQSVRPQSQH